MSAEASTSAPEQIQLHLMLPYNIEVRADHRVREYLEHGYRIIELQRLTDREALITLSRENE